MNIDKIADNLFSKIIQIIKKNNNLKEIHVELVNPILNYTYKKIYPYIIILFSLLILIFILIIIILLLILKLYLKSKL